MLKSNKCDLFLTDELWPAYNRLDEGSRYLSTDPKNLFEPVTRFGTPFLDAPQTNDEMPVVDQGSSLNSPFDINMQSLAQLIWTDHVTHGSRRMGHPQEAQDKNQTNQPTYLKYVEREYSIQRKTLKMSFLYEDVMFIGVLKSGNGTAHAQCRCRM